MHQSTRMPRSLQEARGRRLSKTVMIASATPVPVVHRPGPGPALWTSQVRKELAALHQALDSLGQGIIEVTPQGRIRWATTRAWQWMTAYWGHRVRHQRQVPTSLLQWARRLAEHPTSAQGPEQQEPYVVHAAGRQLAVRLAARATRWWLFLEELVTREPASALVPAGLTKREADVLTWLAQGKSNADIGAILGISPRTVQKHLERVFQKLGVETRTAAAAYVIELLHNRQRLPSA